jgi:hypothetical protein
MMAKSKNKVIASHRPIENILKILLHLGSFIAHGVYQETLVL